MNLWKIGFEGVNWIRLAQDRDWWCPVVSGSIKGAECLGLLSVLEEGLCSMELIS
jgi:hypothetical protein